MLKRGGVAAFAILFLACLGVGGFASQQPPNQREGAQLAAHNSHNQPTPSAPPISTKEITDAVAHAIEAAAAKAEANQNTRPPDNSTWVFNLLLVIFTGGLMVVGFFQALFLRASVDAGEKAAKAAKDSADAVVSQLRAYVLIGAVEKNEFEISRNDGITLWLRAKNGGQTPAFDVRSMIRTDVLPNPLTTQLPEDDVPQDATRATIPPGHEIRLRARYPNLTAEQILGLHAGEFAIYVWGRVNYRDAFDNARFVKFSMVVPVEKDGRMPGIQLAPEGNDAN
jgi:hypothetical protein